MPKIGYSNQITSLKMKILQMKNPAASGGISGKQLLTNFTPQAAGYLPLGNKKTNCDE
jgi:hypothetical protein